MNGAAAAIRQTVSERPDGSGSELPSDDLCSGSSRRRSSKDALTAALEAGYESVAIEHATDWVVEADGKGIIRRVNPAFERGFGCSRLEVLGRPISILQGEDAPGSQLAALWPTVMDGAVWVGELTARSGDGASVAVEARMAPVRSENRAVVGAVIVMRDRSHERRLAALIETNVRERADLAAAFATVRHAGGPEATARSIATTLIGALQLRGAAVWSFGTDGGLVLLGGLDRDGHETPAHPLPAARAAYLRERAAHGPWIEAWEDQPDHPYNAALVERGVASLAYAPIRSDGATIGLLVIAGAVRGQLQRADQLPALLESASIAGALLGPELRARQAAALGTSRIQAVIRDRSFTSVFQPIVELGTGRVAGYEALTRFDDGTPPDRFFADAAACGLGLALEAATLEAALEASGPLPASVWLNLNVSPEFVLAREPLASLLARHGWHVVLEVTEHHAVADYDALRGAIESLGPKVRLAIDDAGAGFASFRHILELQPGYVKLDRTLVHDIAVDPARQALAAGMVHFAHETGIVLVAEGVETKAEATRLTSIGVPLGQGFGLGRPARAERLAHPVVALAYGRPRASQRLRRPARRDKVQPTQPIEQALNIGVELAAALQAVGLDSVESLRACGAIGAWERIRTARPALATGATLVGLEGAVRGVRATQLPTSERARLRLIARPLRLPVPVDDVPRRAVSAGTEMSAS